MRNFKNHKTTTLSGLELISLAVLLLSGLMIATLIDFEIAAGSNSLIFPTNSTLNGTPYNQFISGYWTWVLGIPNDINPLTDPDKTNHPIAERCSSQQNGSVWFLPHAIPRETNDYQCNIPFGKVIMVPVSMSECDWGTEGKMEDNELRECGQNINTTSDTINVFIDGMKVDTNKIGSPISTDFFTVTYPDRDLSLKKFGQAEPGPQRAIGQGYVFFINELPVGKHEISLDVKDVLTSKVAPEEAKATWQIFIK